MDKYVTEDETTATPGSAATGLAESAATTTPGSAATGLAEPAATTTPAAAVADSAGPDALAILAAGAYAAALSDNTFGSYSFDDACDMAHAAAMRPDALAAALDDHTGEIAKLPADAISASILDDYADAVFAQEHQTAMQEIRDRRLHWNRTRRASIEAYSGLPPEDLGRLAFDAEQGDVSPLLALEERFYLGQ